jgi:hypothetical protein
VDSISTLSEFLLQSGSQYRVFDMGRRVTKISTAQFSDFEHATAPYPYPIQQHAFVGIVFWSKQQSDQHYVWFLKLPLDERGLLEQASRSQFLDLVIKALGRSMEQTPNKEQQSALDHNPIIFKPSAQKLAAFTSQVRHIMKLPPSDFMSPALTYLQDKAHYQDWQSVGYQGLSDIAVRLNDPMFSQSITDAIPLLPSESFCALCCALENVSINSSIATELLNVLQLSMTNADSMKVIHAARALSHAKGQGFVKQAFDLLIDYKEPAQMIDLVVTLSGRYWSIISDNDTALIYLEKLAENDIEQDVFDQLFSDLVFIPECRKAMLSALRNPKRSNKLAGYIANFITA